MFRLKRLIVEIHRRSLWQVLLIYVGAALMAYQAVQALTEGLGLPQWFPALAIVLFIIGLPIVLATAFVQEVGPPAVRPAEPTPLTEAEAARAEVEAAALRQDARRRHRFLTWRNAAGTFVIALAAWGAVAFGWLLIGPGEPATGGAAGERPSIAALPFVNRSGLQEDEYFTDGIHDEILSRLAKISGLSVRGRTSVMQYRDSPKNLREIGRELNARYVLEGGVQRAGETVRINVQLVDAEGDEHLWAETYDRQLTVENLLAVQSEVALRVAEALNARLTAAEAKGIGARPTDNLEAYEYYLRGNDYQRRSEDQRDWLTALQLWERSTELDPSFALPYAEMIRAHCYMRWGFGDRSRERLSRAEAAVARVRRLAPDLSETHVALGWYYYHCLVDYDRALDEFARALATQPNNSDVYAGIGAVQRRQGHWDQAARNWEKASELDPIYYRWVAELADTYSHLREHAKADSLMDRAIALVPDEPTLYAQKAGSYLYWTGDTHKARSILEPALRLAGSADNAYLIYGLFVIDICDGDYGAALNRLSTVGSPAVEAHLWVLTRAQLIAQVYALQGEVDLARAYYDSARAYLERRIEEQPDDARLYSSLGIVYAGLGLDEEAVRAAKTGVDLLPVSRDALLGPLGLEALARVYTMVDDYPAALDQLEVLLSIPSYVSVPLLRIDPTWDPLRDHPRFQELLEEYEQPD